MRVYVHANCQGPPIAEMIRTCFPRWQVISYEVFAERIISDIGRYRYLVSSADIIISQPIHDRYRDRDDLSLSWIRATAKPGCAILVFPSIHFEGQLVGWRTLPFPGYGMPYHDTLLVLLAAMEVSARKIVDVMSSPDAFSREFIINEIDLSTREMERRESADAIDVAVSPFFRQYGYVAPLFHIINHPSRPVLAYMAKEILAALGYSAKIPVGGGPCIPLPHVPCHPAVLRMLDEGGGTPSGWESLDREFYHIPGKRLTRAEYTQESLDAFLRLPRADLLAGTKMDHVLPFLRRASLGVPMIGELIRESALNAVVSYDVG
jgi:Polysaccharide biosynthesis enzyme WcbI